MAEECIGKVVKKTDIQVKQEKQRLKSFLKKVIPESYDTFDVESEYDSGLNYLENKEIITEKIKKLFAKEYQESADGQKEQIESAKGDQERFVKERNDEVEKEVIGYNQSRSYVECHELDKFYTPITKAIDKMCQGYSNLAFVKGRGAIGKSWSIRKTLQKNQIKYFEVCGDTTEAYLYRLLFEHNGEIVWFKDVVRLLRGMNSINLLKSATETEDQRLLTKSSYSKEQDDLPDRFIFKGKIIFDYNYIAGMTLQEDFEALQTRGDFIEVAYSVDDIKNIIKLIAVKDWQKQVTQFLIDNYEFSGHNLLNLRMQWKAFRTYEYCQKNELDWKEELKQELKNNLSKVRGVLYSLIGNKAVRTMELKKLMMKHEIVNTIRTADRKIRDWLLTEELFKVSAEDKNFYICLRDISNTTTNTTIR